MKIFSAVLFTFSLLSPSSSSSLWDDQLCDEQLQRFRNAIANPRENWAVESKQENISVSLP